MIVVFLDHCQAGIVPIVWRFQSGDASKGKRQRLLHFGDGGRHHLWLILRRAVVGGDQVITVDGKHCNHYRPALRSKLLHQCAAVCGQRINQTDLTPSCSPLHCPLSVARRSNASSLFVLSAAGAAAAMSRAIIVTDTNNQGRFTSSPICFEIHRCPSRGSLNTAPP